MSPEPVIDTSADSLAQPSSVMSPEPDTPAARAPTEISEPSTSPEPVTLSRSDRLSNSANIASPLPLTSTASSAGMVTCARSVTRRSLTYGRRPKCSASPRTSTRRSSTTLSSTVTCTS